MSAVIAFPSNTRAHGERLRTVRERIIERARVTKATPEQKALALKVAMEAMGKGDSASWAIYLGNRELPRLPTHRQPTEPLGVA